MKGIVFTEFSDMVESEFSPEILDEIIIESNLQSQGSYTSVGTYDYTEMLQLVTKLSEKTSIPTDELLYAFGGYLAKRFSVLFPDFFSEAGKVFDFMKSLDNHIHVEVNKLYPDAELPKFEFDDSDPTCLIMEYRSTRGLAMLAYGLICGVIDYYNEPIYVEIEEIDGHKHTKFLLKQK